MYVCANNYAHTQRLDYDTTEIRCPIPFKCLILARNNV